MKNYPFNTLFNILISITLLGASACAFAATTDIANAPLASASSTVVKPNMMFIMDDSGSMGWEFLPDTANNNNASNCYRNSRFNGVYYNPNFTYSPPVFADGTSYPAANYNAARTDGFNAGSATINLNTQFRAGNDGVNVQAYYFNYTGLTNAGQPVQGTCYATNQYTRVNVPGNAIEAQNFANWYSYYRTRMLTMKTSAGKAFRNIQDNYRVGYSTIGYTGTDSANANFLKHADFNATQKNAWYAKLYGAIPDSFTPLRAALSKAGQIYAGKKLTGANDPVQYSCQQNFTILSTDGYWNANTETATYGPDRIDGSTNVGNQDGGTTARPLFDALNVSDTLADVAMYYYQTDLRTPALGNCTGALGGTSDVCENNVPGSGVDISTQQHMTTFTLGLGLNGTLAYAEDYLSGGSADYNAIIQGTKNWPNPITNTTTARIDDLWHTAVNGRGTYFSAQNPDSLVSGLSKALAGVSARTGSASAAATSNLQPVAGDNFAYLALYRTVYWDGDLQAKTLDLNTGVISATATWSAQPLLDGKVTATSDTRTIYTFASGSATKLKAFTWAGLTTTEQAYFSNICLTSKLSQCSLLTAPQQTAVSGANLVNFIRGQDGFEDQATNIDKLYRDREHVLGDMVNSQPVYLKAPSFDYVDTNYDTYKNTTEKNRAAIVYIAVNDGMLHAFDGATGAEQWAYIPPVVMPDLYRLADKNYAANHRYFVDGSPTIVDVCLNTPTCTGAEWKSILVGGLNAGGRGYYALDVTSPTAPKALWNFTVANDPDLGYTYGSPIITKLNTGKWVVVVSSGYNNVSPGTGMGYLYVLDAATGVVLQKISTGVGTTTTPSGLGKLNAWVDSSADNTAKRFYGGDLLGNLWRFDINDIVPPAGNEAVLLAQLGQINGATTQPITTKPVLSLINSGGYSYPVVMVGTGRYLGTSDLTDISKQSIYAIKDNLTATGLGLVRTPGVLVEQTLSQFLGTSNEELRTTSTNPVDWSTKSGWYIDLDPAGKSPGERVNIDMTLHLGILTAAGNVPNANACNVGGYAWLYYFNINSGQYLSTSPGNVAGEKLGNALVVGVTPIQLSGGDVRTLVINSDGTNKTKSPPTPPSNVKVKRTGWRELIN